MLSFTQHAEKTCEVFEICRRRQNLTFNHHLEVAAIKGEALRNSLLDWVRRGVEEYA
jgi:hypothetical protein